MVKIACPLLLHVIERHSDFDYIFTVDNSCDIIFSVIYLQYIFITNNFPLSIVIKIQQKGRLTINANNQKFHK